MVKYVDESGLGYFKKKLFSYIYPVGSIYTTTSETDPAQMFGGTWERYAQGQVLVGQNESDDSFKTIGKTGGEKTHKLTTAELAKHNHGLNVGYQDEQGIDSKYDVLFWTHPSPFRAWWGDMRHIHEAGGDQPHNNLQPYVTVRIWRRTA